MNAAHSIISFPASLDSLPAVMAFVESRAEVSGVMPAKLSGLCLAVEEAFVNICSYAYQDGEGLVELACSSVSHAFVLEIADSGPEFDMLSVPEPDVSVPIEQREVGGLGVHLIRHFTDHAQWRRENDKNLLRLTVNIDDGCSHPTETASHE